MGVPVRTQTIISFRVPGANRPRNAAEIAQKRLPLRDIRAPGFIDYLVNMIQARGGLLCMDFAFPGGIGVFGVVVVCVFPWPMQWGWVFFSGCRFFVFVFSIRAVC